MVDRPGMGARTPSGPAALAPSSTSMLSSSAPTAASMSSLTMPCSSSSSSTGSALSSSLTAEGGPRLLACPFWKHCPDLYRDCGQRKLRKLSRVKQHLNLYHRQPFFCASCMDVFPSEAARLDHERARSCSRRDLVEQPPGLSREQLMALHRRPPKDLSVEQQWFTVWDIVFPPRGGGGGGGGSERRPSSAYVDTDVSEDLTSFREFVAANVPRRAADQLESEVMRWQGKEQQQQRLPALCQTRESVQRIIQDCLEDAYEEWIAEFRASRSRRTSLSRPPRPLPNHQPQQQQQQQQQQPQYYPQQTHPPSPVFSSLPSSCYSSSHNSTSTTPSFGPVTPTRFWNAFGPTEEVPVFPDLAAASSHAPRPATMAPPPPGGGPTCEYAAPDPKGAAIQIHPKPHVVTPKTILFSQSRHLSKLQSVTACRINNPMALSNIPELAYEPDSAFSPMGLDLCSPNNLFLPVDDQTLMTHDAFDLNICGDDMMI